MKRVLLTGGTGFIGRNVIPFLNDACILFSPKRDELNMYCESDVIDFIRRNRIEIVIHAANPNPVKNPIDRKETMFEDSIRLFMNLYCASDHYQMMYTLGSGAEFNKNKDISLVKEEVEFASIPYDSYGLAKYTINRIISKSEKQCNLRIFGCYGPTDHESKFITHVINCCKKKQDITIKQDCYFDYLHVYDLGKILCHFIDKKPKYRSYNICTGSRMLLSEIAGIVKEELKSDSKIIISKQGMNNEYTGSNDRLIDEIGDYEFISLREGIRKQIEFEDKR